MYRGSPSGGICAGLGKASSVLLTAELTNEGVEGGREQKAETGHAQHSEQHRCAQRLPHLRACSGRNGEWGNAQNEWEGCHQDRAKARTRGVHRGFGGGDTFLFLLARKLDDEDGVLGGQADENDEADLRQDVDGHAPRKQACDRGEQAHRQDQNDCQRQLPAFVLRDEDEEDEESGCAEDEKSRRAALLLLEGEVGPLKSNALGKNLAGKLLHAMQCRTSGDTWRRYPLHLGGGEQIVARHAVWDR